MTREELRGHCERQIQQFERVEKIMPVTPNDWKRYEEHKLLLELLEQTRWIPVSEKLPDYGVAVLTYDGSCYSVEKRIPTIRDDDGEPISGEWWVSDDYDESNSEYYPNLRDGACIAWMPLPEPYEAESEDKE